MLVGYVVLAILCWTHAIIPYQHSLPTLLLSAVLGPPMWLMWRDEALQLYIVTTGGVFVAGLLAYHFDRWRTGFAVTAISVWTFSGCLSHAISI